MRDEAEIVKDILDFAKDFCDEDEFFACKKLGSGYEETLTYALHGYGLGVTYTGRGYLLFRL